MVKDRIIKENIMFSNIFFFKLEDFPNYYISKCGKVLSICGNKKIIGDINISGYCKVRLRNKNKSLRRFSIHRLVAQTFIPNPENKPQINHKNGIRHDNRVENLEWCTPLENQQHSWKCLNRQSKITYRGENFNAKKTKQLDKEGNLIKIWDCGLDASKELGIHFTGISQTCLGKRKTAGGFKWEYC